MVIEKEKERARWAWRSSLYVPDAEETGRVGRGPRVTHPTRTLLESTGHQVEQALGIQRAWMLD